MLKRSTAQTVATKEQTSHLEVLCKEMRATNEKIDVLWSLTARLGDIGLDLAAIAGSVKGVENRTHAVPSFVSSPNERVGGIGVIVGHKTDEIQRAEEEVT